MDEQTAFGDFRAVVLGDWALERRLETIEGWDAFVPAVISAAAELGVELTVQDIEEARRAEQLNWLARWA